MSMIIRSNFFFQAEDGIRDGTVTGVQTCALPILLAALAGDAAVQGAQPGIGARGGHRGLAEPAADVPVALAGAAGPGGVPGLHGARGQAGPGSGVPGGGEYRRVGAELGDDDGGVALADPGDLIQPLRQRQQDGAPGAAAWGVAAAGQPAGGAGRRGAGDLRQLLPDRLVQPGDLVVDRVDQPQVRGDLERVDVAEPAGQRVFQLLAAGLEPRVPQRGQRLRAALPGDQGVQEPAAAGPEQVRDHYRDLQQRVFQDLLHPALTGNSPPMEGSSQLPRAVWLRGVRVTWERYGGG